MSSPSPSKRAAFALAAALAAWPAAAAAEDAATLVSGAYLELGIENTASELELGVAITASASAHVRAFARVPFTDADRQLVRIDSRAQDAKVGLALDFGREWIQPPGATGPDQSLALSAEVELGSAVYTFEPDAGGVEEERRRQSFGARLDARYWYRIVPLRVAPQLLVAYDRSYRASDAVGIVVPGDGGAPDTVRMAVIAGPGVAPVLAARAGAAWYLPKLTSAVAFGTYVSGAWQGEARAFQPWSAGDTYRGELWVYRFVESPANTRLGVAIFAETTGAGDAEREEAAGLLVQLKVNTNTYAY